MKIKILLGSLILAGYLFPVYAQANFGTSLHATREGKPYWYNTIPNGGTGGFELLANVPISELGCVECHDAVDANGDPYPTDYAPDCVDCHATNLGTPGPVTETDCLGCHGREKYIITNGFEDVHRTMGFECMDCHLSDDMHGDGTSYNSLLQEGAIKADCSNDGCHPSLPTSHDPYDPHGGKIHCTSCHASTNLACYNCHFESQVDSHLKREYKKITGFIMLVNRTKDNKVHPATFQSVSYEGNTWVAFGPSVAHTIVKEGARTCTDCHANLGGTIPAIDDYNADGIMQFATWNSNDSTLSYLQGVVPIPEDYTRSLKMDFITYNGLPSDPLVFSNNWSFVESDWDGAQMLFATPLTKDQMAKLGFDTSLVTSVEPNRTPEVPVKFDMLQNYPNPFNPTTSIKYSIISSSKVQLKIFDAVGNLVSEIVNKTQAAGVYEVKFNGTGLSSGIYYYQLVTPDSRITKKMLLMK